MSEIKWIKVVTDIFDDEKILLIEAMPDADAIIVIWFKLLCLAGRTNNNGVIMLNERMPYTDTMLATIFRRKESTIKLALSVFEQFGMIEIVENVITIPNWEKHQNIEGMQRIKEQTRQRVAKCRENKRLAECNATVTLRNDTDKNRIEEDKEIEKDSIDTAKKRKTKKPFKPPTFEEVQAYCRERNSSVDPKAFFDYFDVGGWIDKNGDPVRNWKQKLITWERYNKPKSGVLPAGKRDDSLDDIF